MMKIFKCILFSALVAFVAAENDNKGGNDKNNDKRGNSDVKGGNVGNNKGGGNSNDDGGNSGNNKKQKSVVDAPAVKKNRDIVVTEVSKKSQEAETEQAKDEEGDRDAENEEDTKKKNEKKKEKNSHGSGKRNQDSAKDSKGPNPDDNQQAGRLMPSGNGSSSSSTNERIAPTLANLKSSGRGLATSFDDESSEFPRDLRSSRETGSENGEEISGTVNSVAQGFPNPKSTNSKSGFLISPFAGIAIAVLVVFVLAAILLAYKVRQRYIAKQRVSALSWKSTAVDIERGESSFAPGSPAFIYHLEPDSRDLAIDSPMLPVASPMTFNLDSPIARIINLERHDPTDEVDRNLKST